MMAEEFAQRVDFFSIGTNDLTQYFLAVDRGSKKIAALYNSFHPAVLRAIAHTIRSAHKHGAKVGMCGEFASDARASGILLGMGLDEFSMSAGETSLVKHRLRNCTYEEARIQAEAVLKMETAGEIMEYVEHIG